LRPDSISEWKEFQATGEEDQVIIDAQLALLKQIEVLKEKSVEHEGALAAFFEHRGIDTELQTEAELAWTKVSSEWRESQLEVLEVRIS